jgi:hypothetical protein
MKQNEERQLVRQHTDEKLYVNKISGSIPFVSDHKRSNGLTVFCGEKLLT